MTTKTFVNADGSQALCSRINAGSLEPGDMVRSEEGTARYRITGTRPHFATGRITLLLGRARSVRMRFNTPVWREVGARAGGIIH